MYYDFIFNFIFFILQNRQWPATMMVEHGLWVVYSSSHKTGRCSTGCPQSQFTLPLTLLLITLLLPPPVYCCIENYDCSAGEEVIIEVFNNKWCLKTRKTRKIGKLVEIKD